VDIVQSWQLSETLLAVLENVQWISVSYRSRPDVYLPGQITVVLPFYADSNCSQYNHHCDQTKL